MNQKILVLSLSLSILSGLQLPVRAESSRELSGIQRIAQSQKQNWQEWFTQKFKRQPPLPDTPGGTRGGKYCLLSPQLNYSGERSTLGTHPVLFWKGAAAQVAVQELGATTFLWSQPVTVAPEGSLQALRYGGPRLEAGKRYEWVLLNKRSQALIFKPFQVMAAAELGPLTRAWLQEEIALRQVNASPQDWAQHQVEFLLEGGHSVDAYQALFLAAVQGRLDAEGVVMMEGVAKSFCSKTS